MVRRRCPVDVPLPGVDVGDAAAQLSTVGARRAARGRGATGDLRIRVRPPDAVTVWRKSQYGRHTVEHPVLTGRLEQSPGGRVRLTGTAARPRRGAALYAWVASVLLLPLVLAPLDLGLPGFLLSLLAAAGLVAAVRWWSRRPDPALERQVAELGTMLAAELGEDDPRLRTDR